MNLDKLQDMKLQEILKRINEHSEAISELTQQLNTAFKDKEDKEMDGWGPTFGS